jgi:hypothetical protein
LHGYFIDTYVITEADTCRKYILPKLYAAGWNDDQISEQKSFTDGRILVIGNKARRRPCKRADRVKKEEKSFFEKYGSEARGSLPISWQNTPSMADVLKVTPISQRGNVIEIANLFGGPAELREAVNQLQALLYAA